MTTRPSRVTELAGTLGGALLAPLVGVGALLRHGRLLHPDGVCYRAEVAPTATEEALQPLAQRLVGGALLRLSSALWRGGREWPDALGIAVRFRGALPVDASAVTAPAAADQDLLLATIARPWLTPLSPLWTDVHDFFDNAYYGVSPFELDGVPGWWRFRLDARDPLTRVTPGEEGSRAQRLQRAVEAGQATLVLSVGQAPRAWHELVELRLVERLDVDQETLRFSPFRDGQGVRPRGFIHALRRATYQASQLLRPRT